MYEVWRLLATYLGLLSENLYNTVIVALTADLTTTHDNSKTLYTNTNVEPRLEA